MLLTPWPLHLKLNRWLPMTNVWMLTLQNVMFLSCHTSKHYFRLTSLGISNPYTWLLTTYRAYYLTLKLNMASGRPACSPPAIHTVSTFFPYQIVLTSLGLCRAAHVAIGWIMKDVSFSWCPLDHCSEKNQLPCWGHSRSPCGESPSPTKSHKGESS